MSRFKLDAHAALLDSIADRMEASGKESEQNALVVANEMLNSTSDGGGTAVAVRTEEYGKWLAELNKRNPFIGKNYMKRAHEYERDDEIVREGEALDDKDAAELLEKGDDGRMHLKDDCVFDTELTETCPISGSTAAFVDMCAIDNTVATRIGWDFDAIMRDVEKTLLDIHADDAEYEIPEDLGQKVTDSIKCSEYRHQLEMLK